MDRYTDYKKAFGSVVTADGKEYAFKQDPYPTGGSIGVPGGGQYSGNWYEAVAEDADGNEYMVCWTTVNWDDEDGGSACTWDNPDYIIAL